MNIVPFTTYRLTARQTAFVARAAGFTGEALNVAVCVAYGESGLDSENVSRNYRADGTVSSTDRGLWQFNDRWHGTVSPPASPPMLSDAEAFNPWRAAVAAYELSRGGSNWSAWLAYTNGSWEEFRPTAAIAVADVLAGATYLLTVKVEGRTAVSPTNAAAMIGCSSGRLLEYNPRYAGRLIQPGEPITLPRGLRPARVYAGPR